MIMPKKFTESLHTHTFRCGHASGTEREYIENAIAAGFDTLGFSDHAPYVFRDGYYCRRTTSPHCSLSERNTKVKLT